MDMKEKMAIGHMENYYLRLRRSYIYTTFEEVEDADWYWSPKEIQMFDELWFDDVPIKAMAKELRRSEVAVFFLSLDRIQRGKIKPRNWSIW